MITIKTKLQFCGILFAFTFMGVSCSNNDDSVTPIDTTVSFRKAVSPLIGFHRGLYTHPENTYEAIAAAADAGFKMVEFDVQMTKDSVLVLSHDATIDRCSNGNGRIDEMTYDELLGYDFGSWAGQ